MATQTDRRSIVLTFVVEKEGDVYVATCRELDTSSFGESSDEALAQVEEATTVYLETLIQEGLLEKVLAERGVTIDPPRSARKEIEIVAHPGEILSARVVQIPASVG
jgi:predicted RNase H-like HicB family nuclease